MNTTFDIFKQIIKNRIFPWIIIIFGAVAFLLLYVSEGQFPNLPLSSGIVALIGAVIGMLLTAFAVSFQLKLQSDGEVRRKVDEKIYEQRITIYTDFISKIWKLVDENEGSMSNNLKIKKELREMCFDKLVFLLERKDTEKLEKIITEIDFNSADEIEIAAICKITNILQESLGNKHENELYLEHLYNAFDKKPMVAIAQNQTTAIEQQQDRHNIQFWYFIMLADEQLDEFKKGNWVLNLLEYRDEKWRTRLLEEVQNDDVVFLFRRGGCGYVGAFKVTGNRILTSPEYENKKYSDNEIKKYDFYNSLSGVAYGDGVKSALSSNLLVEPIAYNSKGVGYQTVPLKTIWRMNNPDRVKFLLNRFNGKDMDWDKNRLDGNGKLDDGTEVEIKPINKKYFSELISKFNL
jgi:hypothetical protein